MFEQVGYKVAVSNAIDIVKEKADEITLSNDENGVAVFLEKLLKKINDMEVYTMLENFESVSPTAILTSYPRTFTDIPYEKDIYKWLAQNCNGNVTLNKQIAPDMEARYKLTNSLLDKSNIKQVLEIAAGYSSRGLIYSQKGYNYVEMDLEEVSRNKMTIIKNIIEIPTNLNIISGNALNSKDYEKCENFLNINSPIAIINEGLMRYLTFEEKRIVAENVYSLLKKYNGIWINCDLTPKKFIQTQNKFLPDFNKNLNNTTSRNRLNDRFDDFNHMKEFFNRIGFNDIEIHKFIEMKPYLSCFDILHIDKDSMDEYLENAIVTVMRI